MTQRWPEQRRAEGMRRPAVKRAMVGEVARGKIAGRENALGDNAARQVGKAELVEALEHDVTITVASA